MTATESKDLKKGARVYWRGDAADSGTITEKRWDAVTITWDNGRLLSTMATCAKSCGRAHGRGGESFHGTAQVFTRFISATARDYFGAVSGSSAT